MPIFYIQNILNSVIYNTTLKRYVLLKKIFLSTLLISLSLSSVHAQDNSITPKQLQALKLVEMPIISAGWIPKGFKLDKVKVELVSPDSPSGITNYQLLYEGPYGKKFSIEAQDGAIGDVIGDVNMIAKTPFGTVDVFFNNKQCVSTNWILHKDRGYKFYGCNKELFMNNVDPDAIPNADAIKIIQNLKLMKL